MAKKGEPTALNIWVLGELFGRADEVPNRVDLSAEPHIRRCLAAGLVTADRSHLRLTEAGKAAIRQDPTWMQKYGGLNDPR